MIHLLKSLSLIIAGCAAITILIQPKKFKQFISLLKKDMNDSQDNKSQKNKSQEQIINSPELPNLNWVKIGKVKRLSIYPLPNYIRTYRTLKFTKNGITTEDNGITLCDRMFQVYNEKTKEFLANHVPVMIRMDALDKSKIQVQDIDDEMPMLIIDIDKETGETNKILRELTTNWFVIRYIDCGEEAANWIKKYLRNSNYRLVRREYHSVHGPKAITDKFNLNFADTEIWDLLMSPTRCVVMTLKSFNTIKEDEYNFIRNRTCRPHILISAPSFPAYAEQNWEWIRIGNIIMRKIVPASRLVPKSLKMLTPSFMGIFYGLYTTGDVNAKDDVFIRVEDQLSENQISDQISESESSDDTWAEDQISENESSDDSRFEDQISENESSDDTP